MIVISREVFIVLKQIVRKYGAMLWTGQVPIERSSESVKEALVSTKGDEFLDPRNDYYNIKENSVPWSYLRQKVP
jgi:hypothetical protein